MMIRQQAPRALPAALLLSSLPAGRRWWGNRHFLVGGGFSSSGRRCRFCCGRTARAAAGRMGGVSGDGVATALAEKKAAAMAMVVGDPASLERKKAAIRDRGPDKIQTSSSLERKKATIRDRGPDKLQVIADFDGTLTRYWIDGCRGQTSHSLLKSNPETDAKIQAQYEYYHPLEYSPTIPIDEKTKLMEEWWEKTHSLLIEGGLTYDDIKKSVSSANIAFRDGVVELFEFLEDKDVPVLVFSAGVADVIEEVFRQKLHRSFRNIKVVSNRMVFDNGRLVAFKGKTIHVLNKNEHALDMAAPVHDQLGDSNGSSDNNASVKKRTNVLLLGDHTGDLGMSDGLNYENRISVGFLNDNIEKSLKTYQEAFDMVLLNDASMCGVLELVSQLCSPSKQ